MRIPWANLAVLALLLGELLTGLAGLLGAGDPFRIAFWLHAVGAYALVVVLFAKAAVVVDVVRRRPGWTAERVQLAVLGALLLAVLATGLVWISAGPYQLGSLSVINLHAFLALALVALLTTHVVERRWIARMPAARDRRAFLRFAGALAVGAVAWRIERPLERLLGLPGARRRFTGSYENGSFSAAYPEVSWINDDPAPIERDSWRLVVDGAVERRLELGHGELGRLGRTGREAVIDCTGGWYAHQRWEGVPLAALLDAAGVERGAHSVSVESVTGYARRFSLDHARGLLLATDVAGAPLSHGHGFPLRLVVPDRRGFDWVKWIVRIRVLRGSYLLQPPLPLT
jgi:molybdopterin-dependent oxidoreductase-like protein protein